MLDNLFKRTEHLVQQSVEYMLKQVLKPIKQTLTVKLVKKPIYETKNRGQRSSKRVKSKQS